MNLQNLYDIVSKIPDDKFDMRFWEKCAVGHYLEESKVEIDLSQIDIIWQDLADHFGISKIDCILLFDPEAYLNENPSKMVVLQMVKQRINSEPRPTEVTK